MHQSIDHHTKPAAVAATAGKNCTSQPWRQLQTRTTLVLASNNTSNINAANLRLHHTFVQQLYANKLHLRQLYANKPHRQL